MMNKYYNIKSFFLIGLLIVLFLVAGCSDDKICKPGETECVGEMMVRICAKGEEQNYWIPFPCGVGEVCQDLDQPSTAGQASDAGPSGTTPDAGSSTGETTQAATATESATGTAMCIGTCEVNEHECLSEQLARYCVDGIHWETYRCEDRETCTNGVCERDPEDIYPPYKVCEPETKYCASDEQQRICASDGIGWIANICGNAMVCSDGDCVVNESKLCDPDTAMCDDDDNSLIRCLPDGVGYEKIACPEDTLCQFDGVIGDQACVGKMCAIGQTCVNQNVNGVAQVFVRECIGGKNYEFTRCESNQRCVQMTPWVAECVTQPITCTPGEVVCGDPAAETIDENLFSVCVDDPDNEEGGARWVVHDCEGEFLTCDEDAAEAGIVPPCFRECTPEEQRCAPLQDLPTGVTQARQICDENGSWPDDEVEACSQGKEEFQVCAAVDRAPGELPQVVCADPVCVQAGLVVEGAGVCVGGNKHLPCDQETGQLSEEEVDCESGICIPSLYPDDVGYYTARAEDGRIRGACLDPDCEQGEQLCVKTIPEDAFTEPENTMRYIECGEDGKWSTKPTNCDDNQQCLDYLDDADLWHVICGGECAPGEHGCTGEDDETDQIRTCSEDGKWGDRADCDFGACDPTRNTCIAECKPKEKRCVGLDKPARDNYHVGTDSVLTCGDNGTWPEDPTECDGSTTCRVSGAGVVLGCIDCVGEKVVGGNEEGLVDSRCDGNTVQDCNGDNDGFDDSTDCGSLTCQPAGYRTCNLTCPGASGHSVICAEQLIQQQCGSCDVIGYGTVFECTATNLESAGASLTSGCAGDFTTAGYYLNDLDVYATYNNSIDVSSVTGNVHIQISTSYSMMAGDYGEIQYSWDNSTWTTAGSTLTSISAGFTDVDVAVAPGANPLMYIRFHFYSNLSSVSDGWQINTVTMVDEAGVPVVVLPEEDFESGTDNWTLDEPWGTETVVGPDLTDVTVITESPAVVPIDFGDASAWAGVPNDDCCLDAQTTNTAYTCPTDIISTDNYTDCCLGYADIGGPGVAWCMEDEEE